MKSMSRKRIVILSICVLLLLAACVGVFAVRNLIAVFLRDLEVFTFDDSLMNPAEVSAAEMALNGAGLSSESIELKDGILTVVLL